jgi:oligoendopeptidase F
VTADVLSDIYFGLLKAYHGDAVDYDEQSRITWSRIPHFYSTPYYVYQYATCYASSAEILRQIAAAPEDRRGAAVERYLALLKAGGSDHPMTLLKNAGVDLSRPETVQSVVHQLDELVTQLEAAVASLP